MEYPSPVADASPQALYDTYAEAYRLWMELYSDTEWWVDARKRRTMLLARLAYQEAKLRYAHRTAPPLAAPLRGNVPAPGAEMVTGPGRG